MLTAEKIGSLSASRQPLYRPIEYERYKKPQVVEYPKHATVLNPQHTQQQQTLLRSKQAAGAGSSEDPLEKRKAGGLDVDDDDPRFADPSTFICSDVKLDQLMHLTWINVGPAGSGLDNLGNTCFANAVLQSIAYTPALAQYFAQNFKEADTQVGAPYDFAYALGEVIRQAHLSSKPRSTYRPACIVNHLRSLSPHFQLGRQCDAHEFAVQLLFAAQKSILFRYAGATKLPHRKAATTALLRICGGFLLSQVSWSREDEMQQLMKKGKRQEAADLKLEAGQGKGDVMCSNTYDPVTILTVDLAGQTLEHCLSKFCEKETLDGRCYHTPRDVGVRAQKQFSLHVPPNVLIIQIKRFSGNGEKARKQIRYPLELNLQPFCTPKTQKSPVKYVLNAVCVHQGHSIHSGHYYSVVRARNGSWYECNDSMVRSIPEDRALSQEAYMLFYSRIASSAPPPSATTSAAHRVSHVEKMRRDFLRTPSGGGEEEVGRAMSDSEVAQSIQGSRLLKKRKLSDDGETAENEEDPSDSNSSKQRQRVESHNSLESDDPSSSLWQSMKHLPPLPPASTFPPVQSNTKEESKRKSGIVSSSVAYGERGIGGGRGIGGRVSWGAAGRIPQVLQRGPTQPKFQQQIRDVLWESEIDKGKLKKVKSASPQDTSGRNRFQEASQRHSGLRGKIGKSL